MFGMQRLLCVAGIATTTGTRPFIIGVAGGTASGKSALTAKVVDRLAASAVAITQDAFYRDLTPSELDDVSNYNFDAPGSVDVDKCIEILSAMKRGEGVRIPEYDFVTNSRKPPRYDRVIPEPPRIVVFEGILAFYDKRLRALYDLMIFVDVEADIRLARRIRRDIESRGRDLDGVLRQYVKFVKPAFDEFCAPTKVFADVIVPRGAENEVALDIIVNGIKQRTFRRSLHDGEEDVEDASSSSSEEVQRPRLRRFGAPDYDDEEEEEEEGN